MRDLMTRFEVRLSTAGLVEETQQAILDATDFNERQINYNFDYDYEAYATIQRNFKRMVTEKRFGDLMSLSLELMRRGSYQVEMSDEGLMTDEIENCLKISENVCEAHGSLSTASATSTPAKVAPRLIPPAPENRSTPITMTGHHLRRPQTLPKTPDHTEKLRRTLNEFARRCEAALRRRAFRSWSLGTRRRREKARNSMTVRLQFAC